jgi:hypothetical protein
VYYLFDFDYSVGFNFYIGKLYLYSLYPFPHPYPLSPLFYLFLLSKLTTTMEIGLWPWLKLYGPSSLAMEVEPLSSSMGMEVP